MPMYPYVPKLPKEMYKVVLFLLLGISHFSVHAARWHWTDGVTHTFTQVQDMLLHFQR